MKKEVLRLMNASFNGEEKQKREKILGEDFSNKTNVRKLAVLLF